MFDFCLENHNSLLYRKQYETLSYTNQSENKFNFKIYFQEKNIVVYQKSLYKVIMKVYFLYNKKIIISYKFRQNFCRISSRICLYITKKGKNKDKYTIVRKNQNIY